MRVLLAATALTAALMAGGGCSGPNEPAGGSNAGSATDGPVAFDRELAEELLAMQRADQRGTGVHEERQARLAEIFDEHGWPGHELVGPEGSTAAWVIAQHSDLDLAFQERALGLLSEAVAAGDASPGDLAYLSDRVAVAKGEPQTYGTQVRCVGKEPIPPTPIADAKAVDELRAEAGLEPLDDYLADMGQICRQG